MSAELERLMGLGVFAPVDRELARSLVRLVGGEAAAGDGVALAIAFASRALRRGHVCVDLRALSEAPLFDDWEQPVGEVALPPLDRWLAAIAASPLTAHSQEPRRPLVLDPAGRLYLYRYADYQARLAKALRARAERPIPVDVAAVRPILDRLFPKAAPDDAQRLAVLAALRHHLAIVSGGPGTGKTTTVARLLGLLQQVALDARGAPLRIALVAPTGKAAQRLGEALDESLGRLDLPAATKEAIQREASTIHRALGFDPRRITRFRHDADHPLGVDLVVADEASMIDLALMTKLVEAVPPSARLVLLGDRDQLASVEAGAILGDIFDPAAHRGYRAAFAELVTALTDHAPPVSPSARPIDDTCVLLRKSYRFSEDSGIGALARAVNAGEPRRALAVLRGEGKMPYGEVAIASLDARRPFAGALGTAVIDGYRGLAQGTPDERLQRLGQFRVLCAHRRGPLGVELVNELIEQLLEREGILPREGRDGRPVIITENDHQLGLFNGDIGVVVEQPGRGQRVCFFGEGREVRSFHPGRLPPHELVFAMTVHKSQGTELDRVALVLPPRPSPILTRELVYTAITRAKKRVDVYGDEAVLEQAIARRVRRSSGLGDAIRSAR